MHKLIFIIAATFTLQSCNSQVKSKTSSQDDIVKNKTIISFISKNNDIIGKCLFCMEDSSPIQKRILNINRYDSLMLIINKDSSFAYNYLKNIIGNDTYNIKKHLKPFERWCYCYHVFESIFIFDNNFENSEFTFENIAQKIPELKPILNNYLKEGESINSFSTTQSEMFFLHSVTYISQLQGKNINDFFSKYFNAAKNLE